MEISNSRSIAINYFEKPKWLKYPEERFEWLEGPPIKDNWEIACQAVWYNEIEELNSKVLLEKVAAFCIESQSQSLATPFCYAAQLGDKTIMQLFLDAGWPVNGFFLSENGHGGAATVPLCYAAASGNLETTKILLEAGAKPDLQIVNVQANAGLKFVTVLQKPEWKKNEDGSFGTVVKPEPDYYSAFQRSDYCVPDGTTPLSIALWEGHQEVFQEMLKSFPAKMIEPQAISARDFALKTIQELPEDRQLKIGREELVNRVNSVYSNVALVMDFSN